MKKLNLFLFISLMGSSTLALASKLFFSNLYFAVFSYILELGIIIFFVYYFILFLISLFHWKEMSESLKNPKIANLYSAIPISAALISQMLIKIGIPFFNYDIPASFIFWLISAFFSLFFVVVVPINLKFRSKIKDIFGAWFIPPVGLFVLISAGSALGMAWPILKTFMSFFNLLILGPAFVLYFLTLSLLYLRTKIEEIPPKEIAPTFNIVLAPVAVSILAVLSSSKLLGNFYGIGESFTILAKIYSLMFFGYGLWVILGLLLLYKRIIFELGHIPFSEIWWAFIFPLGAFTLATFNLYCVFKIFFFKILYLLFYIVLLVLWIYTMAMTLSKKKGGNNQEK